MTRQLFREQPETPREYWALGGLNEHGGLEKQRNKLEVKSNREIHKYQGNRITTPT